MTGPAAVSPLSPVAADAAARIRRLLVEMQEGSWFAALGEPATEGERAEVALYLEGSGLGHCPVDWLADWAAARDISQSADWDHAWWEGEQARQRTLYEAAAAAFDESVLLRLLTDVTDAAGRLLHGPAAVAAAASGVADPGLIRAAAGAAAQAAYQAALARLALAGADHPFAAKFRLYLAGRWPLVVARGRFSIL